MIFRFKQQNNQKKLIFQKMIKILKIKRKLI